MTVSYEGKEGESKLRIETERLIIRELELPDAEAFVEMASDGSMNDVGFDPNCGEWMKGWIIEAQELEKKDDPRMEYLAYVIVEKKTGKVIGTVGSSYYEDMKKVGITFGVSAAYRNLGYATEAARAYIDYYFKHYDETEIIATVRDENIPSWKVIEKAGFELTDIRTYQDINDEKEELTRFYQRKRN